MAVAPFRNGQMWGWFYSGSSTTSLQLLASTSWWAYAFVPDSARTINTLRAYVSAVAGTLASGDITASLYDSTGTNGAPGSSIETGKLPSATITAAGWYDFTGFSTALTAGQLYYIVLKTGNATPASNNCTFRTITFANANPPLTGSSLNRQGWGSAFSTDGGLSWNFRIGSIGHRIGYSDGSFDGIPVSATASAAVGDGVYSTRESGIKFTSPINANLKVYGIGMYLNSKTGAPTGNPRFGLWTGSTPSNLGYTANIPSTANTTIQWLWSYFSSPKTIPANTEVRVTLAESTQSDASSDYYALREISGDTDSNSVLILPCDGTATKTYFDGSSWTDSPLGTSLFGFALLLDTAGEFSLPISFPVSRGVVG